MVAGFFESDWPRMIGRFTPPAHLWRADPVLGPSPVDGRGSKSSRKSSFAFRVAMEPSNCQRAPLVLGDLYFPQRGFYEGAGESSRAGTKNKIAFYQLKYAKACAISGRATEARQSANLAKARRWGKIGRDALRTSRAGWNSPTWAFWPQISEALHDGPTIRGFCNRVTPLTDDPQSACVRPLRDSLSLLGTDHVLRAA